MAKFVWEISEVQEIVDSFQGKKIGHVFVDVQSANAMVKIFDQFNEANKIKVQSISIGQFAIFVWDIIGKR